MSGGKVFYVLGALVHEVKTDSQSVDIGQSSNFIGIYGISIYN